MDRRLASGGRFCRALLLRLLLVWSVRTAHPNDPAKQFQQSFWQRPIGADSNARQALGSPSFIVGRIACTKTADSQRFIQLVNAALRQLYHSNEFYQAHTRYLDTADLPLFDRYFRQVFLPVESKH